MARQALFVMAKDPRAGQVKTRLCPPLTPEVAAGLYQCFLLDVLDLVAGIPGVDPVIAFSPPEAQEEFSRLMSGRFQLIPQEGADLGARLENSFRVLFQQGYTRVAAVSTDTPDLPAEYLQEAFSRLRDAQVVLGPCPDGGYYLIGLSSPTPELFRDMPWSTDRVVPETDARVKRMGLALSYLPEWHDVDTPTDLDRLVRDLAGGKQSASRAPRTAAFCQQQLHGRAASLKESSIARIPWRQVTSRRIYANKWMALREDQVHLPDGRETIYGVVDCGNCVGVLPFVDSGHVVLVGQYRYVAQRFTWEMPTGGVRPGESLEAAAQRELAEEAGHSARRLTWISTYHTSKSVMNETAHLYLGEDLTPTAGLADETEFIERKVFPFPEVLEMVRRAEITDSMTVIAVLHTALRLQHEAPAVPLADG